MINYRFLNYKRYSTFQSDIDQISNDSVVFIQDKCCIWARGQLYKCGGAGKGSINESSLVFKDNDNNVRFTITQDGDTLILKDSEGNESRARYALKSDIISLTNQIDDLSNRITHSDSGVVENLSDINDALNALKTGKQDRLIAGSGIQLQRNGDEVEISSTIDSGVYTIVQELPSVETANPDKIYILEIANQNNSYDYVQYRLRNGQWAVIEAVTPTINLSGYLKSSDAADLYQIKGSYLTAIDLIPYVKTQDLSQINNKFNDYVTLAFAEDTYQKVGDYATKEYVLNTFVKKQDVYTPTDGDSESGDSGGISPVSPSPSASTIVVDSRINEQSTNPVENRAIARALQNKVDNSTLNEYTRRDYIDSHFVTISSAGYDALVQSGQIQYDAIYFVYEGEESTTWGFGDRFPIILTDGNTPNSIGTFPITLTEGSTPNSIGTFPINLA